MRTGAVDQTVLKCRITHTPSCKAAVSAEGKAIKERNWKARKVATVKV